ncbi:MAG: hypothetical protein KIT11_09650 [Fimbriimonadaceae bacterium]|nr:hypothetical protein [Fimbriimonadaceae bacterium]QYK55591.1 MAG: hypothetical protein KF733_11320 [Fimbriimonadaceae bacterium]
MRPALVTASLAVLALGLMAKAPALEPSEPKVNFSTQVKPILAKNCYRCHSANDADGGLALDSTGSIKKGGRSGKLFVPGKSKESLLVMRIKGEGGKQRMPKRSAPLSDADIALIAKWIDEGANF